jgi:hypothetical protein
VVPRDNLDVVEEQNLSCSCGCSNPELHIPELVTILTELSRLIILVGMNQKLFLFEVGGVINFFRAQVYCAFVPRCAVVTLDNYIHVAPNMYLCLSLSSHHKQLLFT